jgi:hypothetical protein
MGLVVPYGALVDRLIGVVWVVEFKDQRGLPLPLSWLH